eukprot:m.170175 g.170175  ORF g.170175 m.170175 type:complete len:273 (+) comp31604_c1_seq7:2105-2923(+)
MSNNINPFDDLVRMMEAFHNAGSNNGQGFDIPTILNVPDMQNGDSGQTPRQRILRRQPTTMDDEDSHVPPTSTAMPINPFFQIPQHSYPPHTPSQTLPQQPPWDTVFDQGSDGQGLGRIVGGLIGSMLGSVLMGGFPDMESDGMRSSSSSHSMSSYSSSSTVIGQDGVPVTTITTKKTVDGQTTTETKVLRGGHEVEPMLVNPLRLRDTTELNEDHTQPYGTVRVNPETEIHPQTIDLDQSSPSPSPPTAQPNTPQGNNAGGLTSLFGKIFG